MNTHFHAGMEFVDQKTCQHATVQGTHLYQTVVCLDCGESVFLDGCVHCQGYFLGGQPHHQPGCPAEGRLAEK